MFVRNAHGDYKSVNIKVTGNCSVKGCTNKAIDIAHVRKCDKGGNLLSQKVYVVPMCTQHNRSKTDSPLELNANTSLIEINP